LEQVLAYQIEQLMITKYLENSLGTAHEYQPSQPWTVLTPETLLSPCKP
jgi:hypothetical protein